MHFRPTFVKVTQTQRPRLPKVIKNTINFDLYTDYDVRHKLVLLLVQYFHYWIIIARVSSEGEMSMLPYEGYYPVSALPLACLKNGEFARLCKFATDNHGRS